jgi:hypothetical protein
MGVVIGKLIQRGIILMAHILEKCFRILQNLRRKREVALI